MWKDFIPNKMQQNIISEEAQNFFLGIDATKYITGWYATNKDGVEWAQFVDVYLAATSSSAMQINLLLVQK